MLSWHVTEWTLKSIAPLRWLPLRTVFINACWLLCPNALGREVPLGLGLGVDFLLVWEILSHTAQDAWVQVSASLSSTLGTFCAGFHPFCASFSVTVKWRSWYLCYQGGVSIEQVLRNCESEKVKVLVAQLCPTLCYPTDCSPPGSTIHGYLQARILEWFAMPFSISKWKPLLLALVCILSSHRYCGLCNQSLFPLGTGYTKAQSEVCGQWMSLVTF